MIWDTWRSCNFTYIATLQLFGQLSTQRSIKIDSFRQHGITWNTNCDIWITRTIQYHMNHEMEPYRPSRKISTRIMNWALLIFYTQPNESFLNRLLGYLDYFQQYSSIWTVDYDIYVCWIMKHNKIHNLYNMKTIWHVSQGNHETRVYADACAFVSYTSMNLNNRCQNQSLYKFESTKWNTSLPKTRVLCETTQAK